MVAPVPNDNTNGCKFVLVSFEVQHVPAESPSPDPGGAALGQKNLSVVAVKVVTSNVFWSCAVTVAPAKVIPVIVSVIVLVHGEHPVSR